MRRTASSTLGLLVCAAALQAGQAQAAEKGEVIQTDSVGMNLVTWNLSKGAQRTVADEQVLSQFVGAHVFLTRSVRVGLNVQFSEQLSPEPTAGDRFRTFALLPQVGWNVGGPFFVAGIFTFAPRTSGTSHLVLGVQALGGAGFEVAKGVRLSLALEVPYNFYPDSTIGLTPILGAAFAL